MSFEQNAMPNFSAEEVADKLEILAQKRMKVGGIGQSATPEGQRLAKEACETWRDLNKEQRAEVGNELVRKYDNADLNTLPRPAIETNPQGEMIGIQFHKSGLELIPGPSHLHIVADKGMITMKKGFGGESSGIYSIPDKQ
jgi:hypothetical protein